VIDHVRFRKLAFCNNAATPKFRSDSEISEDFNCADMLPLASRFVTLLIYQQFFMPTRGVLSLARFLRSATQMFARSSFVPGKQRAMKLDYLSDAEEAVFALRPRPEWEITPCCDS
jgi:hypothetical protein